MGDDADLEWVICLCSNALNATVETTGDLAPSASPSCTAPVIPRTFKDCVNSRTHLVNNSLSYLLKVQNAICCPMAL